MIYGPSNYDSSSKKKFKIKTSMSEASEFLLNKSFFIRLQNDQKLFINLLLSSLHIVDFVFNDLSKLWLRMYLRKAGACTH